MAKFKSLNTKKYLKPKTEITPDFVYWKHLQPPTYVKEFGAIDYIDFSSIEPYNFAVTCSVRVQIYDPIAKLLVKSLSRFTETAYGGQFRRDGRLLVAGDEEGLVKLFDTNSKNVLRMFKGHKEPVHRVNFTNDLMQIVSYSDDKTVKLWDLSTEKNIHTFAEHQDYIRAGVAHPFESNVFVSGGYDGVIVMYDARSKTATFTMDHESPVESLLFLPTGGIIISAGGTEMRVWDAVAGCRLLACVSQHHKTVTCLRLASDGKRVLSASLDKHVKIFDVATYQTVHTLNFPSSVLSLAVAPNDQTVVAGMVDGMVSIQNMSLNKRTEHDAVGYSKQRRRRRYITPKPIVDIDHEVQPVHKDKLAKYDVHLRNYEYVKCLDEVMKQKWCHIKPEVTVSVMQELIHRKGLHRALAARSNAFLTRLIKFICRHIGENRFMRVLIAVADILLDVYQDEFNEFTGDLSKQFIILAETLNRETKLTYDLLELQGMLELMLNVSDLSEKNEIIEFLPTEEDNIINSSNFNNVSENSVAPII